MAIHSTALLVIDAQFGPLWGTFKTEEVLQVIGRLTEEARSHAVPIVYVQHEDPPGGPLAPGTPFWQLHPSIVPQPGDVRVAKYAADAFYRNGLLEKLKELGSTRLIITGARTDYCIDTTCRAALSLGFDVTLAADGHTCADGVLPAEQVILHHNAVLGSLRTPENKLEVLPSEHIFDQA